VERKKYPENIEQPKPAERPRWDDLRKYELVEINERLHQSIEDLQRAREQLAYTNHRLSEDNAALRQESEDLRMTNHKLHRTVRELGEENISLLEANLRLADQNRSLTQENSTCANAMGQRPGGEGASALTRLRAWIRAEKK
jgi:FtsZ-binding cell division protein ZapB